MDWENFVGYAMMVAIAAVSVAFVWALIIGVCIIADAFGVH